MKIIVKITPEEHEIISKRKRNGLADLKDLVLLEIIQGKIDKDWQIVIEKKNVSDGYTFLAEEIAKAKSQYERLSKLEVAKSKKKDTEK